MAVISSYTAQAQLQQAHQETEVDRDGAKSAFRRRRRLTTVA